MFPGGVSGADAAWLNKRITASVSGTPFGGEDNLSRREKGGPASDLRPKKVGQGAGVDRTWSIWSHCPAPLRCPTDVDWSSPLAQLANGGKVRKHGCVKLQNFYALKSGDAPTPQGGRASLSTYELGMLRVPSGMLGACDPFAGDLADPVVIPIPAGDYPVTVTVADVSEAQDRSHLREAYLSVIVSDRAAVSLDAAVGNEGPPADGMFYGVGVDAGTVAFVDALAAASAMPNPSSWYELFDNSTPESWFNIMDADAPYPAGSANIVMPLSTAGENVTLVHSGWGDGFYPLLQTTDADGQLLGVHLDLGVVGEVEGQPLL